MSEKYKGLDLPLYQSHKIVQAMKIKEVRKKQETSPGLNNAGPNWELTSAFDVVCEITPEFVRKHNPTPGDYYVVYEDGYDSISPATAFEAGYEPLRPEDMTNRQLDVTQPIKMFPLSTYDNQKFSQSLAPMAAEDARIMRELEAESPPTTSAK
jgi:hypothetical protein